jgi:hypothetical protein
MLKIIIAIDTLRGIVTDVNEDIEAYIKDKTSKGQVLNVPDGHLEAISGPLDPKSYIESLRDKDGLVWAVGGSEVLELAVPLAKEIIIIQLNGVFKCKDYFPHFEDTFYMEKKKPIRQMDGLMYQFQLWKPDLTNLKDSWDFDIGQDIE